VAKVLSMPIELTVGTVSDISRVSGRFEPNFELLSIRYSGSFLSILIIIIVES
jgi:hypothetical protein